MGSKIENLYCSLSLGSAILSSLGQKVFYQEGIINLEVENRDEPAGHLPVTGFVVKSQLYCQSWYHPPEKFLLGNTFFVAHKVGCQILLCGLCL